MKSIIIGITGASGSIYAIRLIEQLVLKNLQIHLVITDAGKIVIEQELGWKIPKETQEYFKEKFKSSKIIVHPNNNVGAKIASGSAKFDAMVILPCTMATVASIAHGLSGNLMERAADVILKEKRKLIIVPRETPLNQIHLQNMLTLSQAGVHLVPAMPAFYYNPQTIDELVNFIVGRILDYLDIDHSLFRRWEG